MSDRVLRLSAASALVAALIFGLVPASAQSGDPKAAEKAKQSESQAKKAEELSDTAKATSGPAGNPECVWLGTRVANLLYRQDMDTAFRHLDLYDRFGCPGGHIQSTFRCLVRHGNTIDVKTHGSLDSRVNACWINPAIQPAPPAAAQNPAAPTGTSTQ
ncbi:MAG TPA: beta-1-3, beta-1-6-glucan biosynthesis protein [Pseudorhodoplanes sp.]|nr:beta-1-3, beta-1-6-glucan biosynthesis protein [Pseudorhodoplanes sp.]